MPDDTPPPKFPNVKLPPDELRRAVALWVRLRGWPCDPEEVRLWVDTKTGVPWAEVVRGE